LLPIFLVLGFLGLWVYWPGVIASPILDDLGNLDKLRRLSENPEYARDYVFGNRSGSFGRPVAMATFVFEKLHLSAVPHVTLKLNVILHIFNGLLVSGLLYLLFSRAAFRQAGAMAALLGGLWLLAPMQVSTVLYQVQRMAMLCTSFMLLSCICYLLWRMRQSRYRRLWLLCSLICAGMALFSKENGIVIVPVLLLMETLWLSSAQGLSPTRQWPGQLSLGLIVLGMLAVLTGVAFNWSNLQGMHGFREFTLEERLLTQMRALWDYAGQFLWPDLSRLGLYHDDFPISRSLWQPVTTGWSLGAWLALLGGGLYLCRYSWGRLLLLGPALYLVGHGIEGSVFPLELYFEHRNYFPSIGLLILLGTVAGLLGRLWPQVGAPLMAWLGLAVLVLAMMTSSQVQVWSSPELRILHHVNGHPQSFRANADMAVLLAEAGDLEAAIPYATTASEVGRNLSAGDHAVFALLLNCLARVSFNQANIELIGSGQANTQLGSSNILLALVRVLQNQHCPESGADRISDRLSEVFIAGDANGSDRLFFALAAMENVLEHYGRANKYVDRFLARTDRKSTALLMKLHFLTALGDQSEADQVVSELQRMVMAGQLTQQERDNLDYYLVPVGEADQN
jgi:protein O-mannosyl-transferase